MTQVTSVPSRAFAFGLWFGPLFLCGILIPFAVAMSEVSVPATVISSCLAALLFMAWPVLMWVWLLRGARLAREASADWYAGWFAQAKTKATSVLKTVFRADIRARALHTLGLCAEAETRFEEAADRFRRATDALPMMAAPVHKRRALVLIRAHRAFCLAASGNIPAAEAELLCANRDYGNPNRSTADAFLDDSTWGLGSISINTAVLQIEVGRDPRAVLALAWGMVFFRKGEAGHLTDLCEREASVIAAGLLPRERMLLENLRVLVMRRLGASPMRSVGGIMDEAQDPWSASVISGGIR